VRPDSRGLLTVRLTTTGQVRVQRPQLTTLTNDRISPIHGVDDFWDRVSGAEHVYLFLDYDGTLAPFHVERMRAVPLPGTADAVRRIIDDRLATVAMVSGRPVAEVLALLGDLGVTIAGSHGYEVRRGDGTMHVARLLPEQETILDRAFEQALQLLAAERVERKSASVAVHFRGMDPRETSEAETKLERLWRAAGTVELVEFRPFNGGLELRAAGRNKGTVIEELLADAPSGTLPVYIGDDDTDEDAFGALPPHGIGVKVGPMEAVTKAKAHVPNCEAVRQLLLDWPLARGRGR
jgi:trehalose 6-phosphate phosphatase